MELAGRKERLIAVLIDAVVGAIPWGLASAPQIAEPLRIVAVLGVLGVTIYQIVLLTKEGRTIGKKFLGLRIVLKETGENGGFVTNVLLRTMLNGFLCFITIYLFFLIDSLFIFRKDRRCLHDMMAGTVVVKG